MAEAIEQNDEQPAIEAEEPGRPEWLPQQFNDPADLAKSYTEIRKEADRLREENRKQQDQFTEALSRFEQQQTPQYQGQDPMIAQYQQALDTGDAAAALAIQVAITQAATAQMLDQRLQAFQPAITQQDEAQREIAFTMAQERLARQYGDRWDSLQPQVFERLRNDQRLLPTVASVDGYAMSMIEQANIIEAGRIVAENTAAEADRLAKIQAQGIQGSTSRGGPPTDADKAAWERVQNAPTNRYSDLFKS